MLLHNYNPITVDPGEATNLQVCICSIKKGPFSCTLLCQLDDSAETVALPITGKVEVSVCTYVACLYVLVTYNCVSNTLCVL